MPKLAITNTIVHKYLLFMEIIIDQLNLSQVKSKAISLPQLMRPQKIFLKDLGKNWSQKQLALN